MYIDAYLVTQRNRQRLESYHKSFTCICGKAILLSILIHVKAFALRSFLFFPSANGNSFAFQTKFIFSSIIQKIFTRLKNNKHFRKNRLYRQFYFLFGDGICYLATKSRNYKEKKFKLILCYEITFLHKEKVFFSYSRLKGFRS